MEKRVCLGAAIGHQDMPAVSTEVCCLVVHPWQPIALPFAARLRLHNAASVAPPGWPAACHCRRCAARACRQTQGPPTSPAQGGGQIGTRRWSGTVACCPALSTSRKLSGTRPLSLNMQPARCAHLVLAGCKHGAHCLIREGAPRLALIAVGLADGVPRQVGAAQHAQHHLRRMAQWVTKGACCWSTVMNSCCSSAALDGMPLGDARTASSPVGKCHRRHQTSPPVRAPPPAPACPGRLRTAACPQSRGCRQWGPAPSAARCRRPQSCRCQSGQPPQQG